jgi:hypothetical protein
VACRLKRRAVAHIFVVLLGLYALAAPALALDGETWSTRWTYDATATQTVLGQSYRPRQEGFALAYLFSSGAALSGQHEYRILDLPLVGGQAASTNGHVHRLSIGWSRQDEASLLRIGAALAVSSNALKHLDDLSFSDLRPDAALERNFAGHFRLGVRADDRLGRTLIYPSAAWHWQPASTHEIRLGVPDSSWRWRLRPDVETVLGVAPGGGSWRVRDRALARHSEVRIRSWLATFAARWQPMSVLAIEARVGRRFAGQLRYVLLDGTEARVDVPDANVFGIALEARF